MWRDNLRGIFYIVLKDMKTYYLKPPAVSWGIVFPVAWILAFYLRSPGEFGELLPGLLAMTILFSTTAVEAVVFNLELRLGSFERLLLAPLSLPAVLLSKVFGGAIFGLMMTILVALGSVLFLKAGINIFYFVLILFPSLLAFSALGSLLCIMVREVFEAQTLLNLPRFLMIFLSGVVYPVSAMPAGLQYLAHILPLTYTVEGMREALAPGQSSLVVVYSLILVGFFAAFIWPAIKLFSRRFS